MQPPNQFTEREREVIDHLLTAKTNKQISLALGVSVRTVEFHLGRIYSKLGVASRAEAIVRLAANHRWESTVAEAKGLPQDTSSPHSARRFPMRTLAYIAAISIASLVIVVLLARGLSLMPQTQPTTATTTSPAMTSHEQDGTPPTAPPPATDVPSDHEFLLPPQSLTSSSGVTVEVSDLAFGPNCLRLQVLAHGLPAPADVFLGDTAHWPFSWPFSDVLLYDPSSATRLFLTKLRGGGGGALAADGSYVTGQEAVYDFAPPSLQGSIPLTLQVITDEPLGFEAPLVFHLEALRSEAEMCGLQGSFGP